MIMNTSSSNIGQETDLEGRCTCGAVHYHLTRQPLFVHCCHCTWCQRETGSAFAVNALIETSHVQVTRGTVVACQQGSASGRGQTLINCDTCHTTLWSYYASAQERVSFVRVGTLLDPGQAPPDIHIFTSTKFPWVILPDGQPAVSEYYRRSDLWPEQSQQRYKAALMDETNSPR